MNIVASEKKGTARSGELTLDQTLREILDVFVHAQVVVGKIGCLINCPVCSPAKKPGFQTSSKSNPSMVLPIILELKFAADAPTTVTGTKLLVEVVDIIEGNEETLVYAIAGT